jgi:hypothetical protein
MLPAAPCRIVTHAATPKQRAFSAFIMLHPLTASPAYHSQYLRQLQTPKLTPYQVADICMPHHEPKFRQTLFCTFCLGVVFHALLSCRRMMQPSACRSSSAIVVENALKCVRNSPDPLWKNPSKGKHTNEGDVRVQKNARICARVCSVFFYSALARFARTETPCLNNKITTRPKHPL